MSLEAQKEIFNFIKDLKKDFHGIEKPFIFEKKHKTFLENLFKKTKNPFLIGKIFEASLNKSFRAQRSVHYTTKEDILKLIEPLIIYPWWRKINSIKTQKDLIALYEEFLKFKVLDPACGSGNFLLVSYQELKKIEIVFLRKFKKFLGYDFSETKKKFGFYSLKNLSGIEFDPFSAAVCKICLWFSQKIDDENLGLNDLDFIKNADALFCDWPQTDIVLGNPPFLGGSRVLSVFGKEYQKKLREFFPKTKGQADYCVYWVKKSLELPKGTLVGFVTTNSITQNNSRVESLEKILESGGDLFVGYKSFKWSGEATVHVSIFCFKNKEKYEGTKFLEGQEVDFISERLDDF